MSYYKSKEPKEQVDEAIQILKKAIGKEYSNKKNGNLDYINNKALINSTNFQTLKVNLNFKDRIFHSSNHKYNLSQLARQKEEIISRNDKILNENPRVQLAEMIKESMVGPFSDSSLEKEERRIAVYAIEQLLQSQDNLEVPDYTHRERFDQDFKKSNIGIKKLEKIGYGENFREEIQKISDQYNNNCDKYFYSNHILQNASVRFGEPQNNKGSLVLNEIHNKIFIEMYKADNKLLTLKDDIVDELRAHNITTGLNTGIETFWKKFKIQAKVLFEKLFNKNNQNRLLDKNDHNNPDNSTNSVIHTEDMRKGLVVDHTPVISTENKGHETENIKHNDSIEVREPGES